MANSSPLLQVKNLSCFKSDGSPIIENFSFSLKEGDILVLNGKSGAGKSTVLKALAHLNPYKGEVFFQGRTPKQYGVPVFRTLVSYVPQRTALLPDTPRNFLQVVSAFRSRAHTEKHPVSSDSPMEIAQSWGLTESSWDQSWSTLSGGEAQRLALAVAIGLSTAQVLLLDEPTSALDEETSLQIEETLVSLLKSQSAFKAIVWITHSHEQGVRVGTKSLTLEANVASCPSDDSSLV